MVCHFHGRYKSAIERKFLEQAEEEITKFCNSCGLRDNSVLVFPPLDAHYRFLIHQLVGESSRLQTVSVGQGRQRRIVVYFTSKRYSQCSPFQMMTSKLTVYQYTTSYYHLKSLGILENSTSKRFFCFFENFFYLLCLK